MNTSALNSSQQLSAFAPASIGNFIVGFDCLGAAIAPLEKSALGDIIHIEAAVKNRLTISGAYAHALPSRPEDNIVHACSARFHQLLSERDSEPQTLAITLVKQLPVGSGLGSSATSVVASLYALNEYYEKPFAEFELLRMCGELEGRISGGVHYDNVAPSLRGGLQLMLPDNERLSLSLPVPDWVLVICYPGICVETKAARAVLPEHYRLSQITQFAERLAAFVAVMQARDFAFAASLLRDDLIEPHRIALVPGFNEAKQAALQAGAMAFGLSGSGPSCLAVCRNMWQAQTVMSAVTGAFPKNENMFAHLARIDEQGARLIDIR